MVFDQLVSRPNDTEPFLYSQVSRVREKPHLVLTSKLTGSGETGATTLARMATIWKDIFLHSSIRDSLARKNCLLQNYRLWSFSHFPVLPFSRKKLFWSHRSGNKCMRISNSLIITTLFSRICKCQKLNAGSSHSFLSVPPFSLSISFPLFYSFSISCYFRFMFSYYFFLSILFLSYLLTSSCHFTILLHFISVLYLCYLYVIICFCNHLHLSPILLLNFALYLTEV